MSDDVSFGIPFFGSGKAKLELSVSADQGWTDTQSTTLSKTVTDTYSGKLPAHSTRLIELLVLATKSDVAYVAEVIMGCTVQFDGFLRWGGNAHNDHPTDLFLFISPFIHQTPASHGTFCERGIDEANPLVMSEGPLA